MYLEYKGHKGSVIYDSVTDRFSGKVQTIKNSNLRYEGANLEELVEEFQDIIDDYFDLLG